MQIPWAAASWASYFDVLVLYWRLIYIYIFSRTTTLCHVRPSTNTSFPTRPCHTFSEYEKHPGKYFNDPNLTLQFLPGNHTPDVNVTKTNIHPLELLGNFSAAVTTTVVCSSKIGLSFRHISKVRIDCLAFVCVPDYAWFPLVMIMTQFM